MSDKTLGQLSDEGAPICEAFHLVAKLCEQRGWMPVGFRRIELRDGIAITVNGTKHEQDDAIGMAIPPFHASVIIGDWPCGIFTMFGGTLMAGTEDRLIDALNAELAALDAAPKEQP